MKYFDTNVLIYASISQDLDKMKKSQMLIKEAVKNKEMLLSPLVIQEYVFSLNKLKLAPGAIYSKTLAFENYCNHYIDNKIIFAATLLASNINFFSNINDIIHLKFAEIHCNRFITYDADFTKLKPYSGIEIEILE